MREWTYIHMELRWAYDHQVRDPNIKRQVMEEPGHCRAWLLRSGGVTVTTPSGGKCTAEEGMWMFCPPAPFHQHFRASSQVLSINFLFQWPSGESVLGDHEGLVFPAADEPNLESRALELERLVRRHTNGPDLHYYSRNTDFGHFHWFHTAFMQWSMEWYRVHCGAGTGMTRLSPDDDRAMRALRCLNTSPLHLGFPREELLRLTGLSEAHLNRLFHAEYGFTLRKSWDNRRLKHAKTFLETSMMQVKEIAFELGFRSDSHFMSWFKQRTGMRPGQYRKSHRRIGVDFPIVPL
ncbi:MAG: AraC family transcriptional regulator [Kiritimatiellae bacterium]|nr:AraC family transcriptional regulator [Kiritimatiellia bacterium]